MTPVRRVLPFAVLAVLLLDTVGSLAADHYGFEYGRLAVVSYALYALAGWAAGRLGGLRGAALVGFCTGLVDATIGWAISWAIGPGRPPAGAGLPLVLALGMVWAVGSTTAVALAGGVVAQFGRGSKQAERPERSLTD
jgi:hypothetical protein